MQVLGLSAVPNAGDEFRAAPSDKTAKTVAEAREQRQRLKAQRADARVQRGVKLEDIFTQIQRTGPTAFDLYVFRSFARSFWKMLCHASEEVGYEVM